MVERYLFLDDERSPADVTWCDIPRVQYGVVRNYDEFVRHVTTFGVPKFVTFDHDLADEHYAVMAREVEANKFTAFFSDPEGGLNITFDYGTEKTGYDCAKWLVDFCTERGAKFPNYTVHSMNPVGRKRIMDYIDNAKKHLNI